MPHFASFAASAAARDSPDESRRVRYVHAPLAQLASAPLADLDCSARHCHRFCPSSRAYHFEDSLRNNPACLSCGVYERLDQNRTILYEEKWESEQGFRNHIRSSSYLALLTAIDLAQSKPKVSFHDVTNTRSMELINALRSRETDAKGETKHEKFQ